MLRAELATFKERVWSAISHVRGEITSEVQKQVAPVARAITSLEAEVVTQQTHLFESTMAQSRSLSSFGDYAGPEHRFTAAGDVRVLNAMMHKMDAVDHDSRRSVKALAKLREGVKQLATDVAQALLARADKAEFEAFVAASRDQVRAHIARLRPTPVVLLFPPANPPANPPARPLAHPPTHPPPPTHPSSLLQAISLIKWETTPAPCNSTTACSRSTSGSCPKGTLAGSLQWATRRTPSCGSTG